MPAIVPLAWFAMAVPARETAHAALGRALDARSAASSLGAAALTAWDLFLDPQMVGEGYWRWARRGRYRGIPLTNFVGWFVTRWRDADPRAALRRGGRGRAGGGPMAAGRVGRSSAEYAIMAVMETVGFAAFFRDPLVAAVGGAAMLPIRRRPQLRQGAMPVAAGGGRRRRRRRAGLRHPPAGRLGHA